MLRRLMLTTALALPTFLVAAGSGCDKGKYEAPKVTDSPSRKAPNQLPPPTHEGKGGKDQGRAGSV
ncbi:MAG TPA: hypothetical protein VFA26_02550 [Gemmataceae bacterium]|nr:hypothetical protein [Gemmataceae bacterium]